MGYYKIMKEKFTIEEIIKAVDSVIGDNGMRSKAVIEILKFERRICINTKPKKSPAG